MSDQRPDAEQPPEPPGSGAPRHWWNASRLRYALIAVVALAGVSLSVASYTFSRDAEIERAAAAFAIDAHIRVAAVEDTLAQDIGALQSIGAFYTASMAVTRDEFNFFTGAILRMNSSISQLAWLPHVPGNERGAFEQAAHADGLTAFEFRDLTASLMPTTAPERESYLPVYYVAPLDAGVAVIGLDLANIDAVVPTLESSRDSGTLVASPRMTGFSSFDGIYIALPIYDTGTPVDSVQARQASFVGALGAFVNVANLIARSLDAHELRGGRTDVVSLIIRDLSAGASDGLLYSDPSPQSAPTTSRPSRRSKWRTARGS